MRYSLALREILLAHRLFFVDVFHFSMVYAMTLQGVYPSVVSKDVDVTEAGPMMIINATRILGYTAMAFAAAALGTQQLAAYQAR